MNYSKKRLEKMMKRNGGSLDLSGTQITSLPDNLTVGGSLDLSGTQITSLPDNLTVGGWLDLSGTQITSLPDNLTVGGSLDLSGTQITSLPDNLTVGGSLYLSGTQITSLPDNLTVGGWLYLSGTQITSLPDNLTVGGWLDLSGTSIPYSNRNKVKRFTDGQYEPNKWLYCDNMLIHIKRKKTVGKYTYYVGKIPTLNVIFDGEHYAHCKSFKAGVLDLEFKKAKDRGAEQYKNLTLESVLTYEEAIIAYRVITGACQAGTEHFLNSLRAVKETYTVAEIIKATKGQYGNSTFENFFKNN